MYIFERDSDIFRILIRLDLLKIYYRTELL